MSMELSENTQKRIRIFLVEDSRSDVILTRHVFKEASIPHQLITANTGEEALQMLQRTGEYKTFILPDVILLDLNLPKMGGLQVLETIKNIPALAHIPVYVLTHSKAVEDSIKSYDLYIKAYIVKPVTVDKLEAIQFFQPSYNTKEITERMDDHGYD